MKQIQNPRMNTARNEMRGRAGKLSRFLRCFVPAIFLANAASGPTATALLDELERRSADDGLAVVCIQNNRVWMKRFDGSDGIIRNPRDLSRAWFSARGDVVVWGIQGWWYRKDSPVCPSPVIVETIEGKLLWQLPSDIAAGPMSVSSDAERVVFYGAFKPPGTCQITTQNKEKWVIGLQYVDRATKVVHLVPGVSEGPSAITWAADGNSFAYDAQQRIFVYDIQSQSNRSVAEGTAPAFSPDGRLLAYRSASGQALALDQKTGETKLLFRGKKITWGVHWSPDSRYVMAAEDRTLAYDVMHGGLFDDKTRKMVIYRLADGATVAGNWFAGPGFTDYGYFWVKDYRAFLHSAAIKPEIH